MIYRKLVRIITSVIPTAKAVEFMLITLTIKKISYGL